MDIVKTKWWKFGLTVRWTSFALNRPFARPLPRTDIVQSYISAITMHGEACRAEANMQKWEPANLGANSSKVWMEVPNLLLSLAGNQRREMSHVDKAVKKT